MHVITELDLVRLIADHRDLERLCAALEASANALPDLPSDSADRLCDALEKDMQGECRKARLTALFGDVPMEPWAEALLERIRRTHGACAVQAQDLIGVLAPSGRARPMVEADTIGYMMRSFFDNCRHLIAFEELGILQLAGERLTSDARVLLADRIAAGCRH